MKEILIDANGAGKRLDKFLFRYLSGAPKSLIYAQLRKKNINLNRKKAEGSEILTEGDTLQCFFSDETWEKFINPALRENDGTDDPADENNGSARALVKQCKNCYRAHPEVRVLYEDEDILLLDKPAGLLTQRARKEDESLGDWLLGYLFEEKNLDPKSLAVFRPSICHRLDRNTSGIVICAGTLRAAQKTAVLLKEHRIGKYYLAVVYGHLQDGHTVTGILEKNESNNTVKIRTTAQDRYEDEEGRRDPRRIVTSYIPVSYDEETDTTLLLARLVTGKTHQLRAQFASLGHPIVGDPKYGAGYTGNERRSVHAKSQLLHSCYTVFPEDADDREGWMTAAGQAFFCSPDNPVWGRFLKGLTASSIRELIDSNRELFGDLTQTIGGSK
ncbi:MAG: RluA family pseudouridine synthase [Lachnospiraceae bacterium]|nr:RluA family pseudouridine synthase [Lachnospiraceae bacterium]